MSCGDGGGEDIKDDKAIGCCTVASESQLIF